MVIIAALICGLIFGWGLLISEMVQPAKVVAFLDIFGAWDPSLAVVMIAALVVSVPGFRLAHRRERPILAILKCLANQDGHRSPAGDWDSTVRYRTVSTASTIVSSNLSSAISTICWISSIIAGQSKYGVDDGISGACDEPPDNVDIDPHLRTQHR
jgi:uncharacterized membrane protein YedE/YeeE